MTIGDGQQVRIDLGPHRPLGLHSADLVNRRCPLELVRSDVGQPEVTHKTLADQFGHGADGLFDRHQWVGEVRVVEIDPVGA